ncbi:hypothetical protein GCM10010270_54050 [Streptomyces violaceus]|nr:hypothetical protein GCM10010270_54050 [Streptomyces janthinus]
MRTSSPTDIENCPPGYAQRPYDSGIDVHGQAFLTRRRGAITRKSGNGSSYYWAEGGSFRAGDNPWQPVVTPLGGGWGRIQRGELGYAICDPVIALWCLRGGPSLIEFVRNRRRARLPAPTQTVG